MEPRPAVRQRTFSAAGFEKHRKNTRREAFVEDMDQIAPWKDLAAAIAPHYPKSKRAGRRPIGVERMLRIHLL